MEGQSDHSYVLLIRSADLEAARALASCAPLILLRGVGSLGCRDSSRTASHDAPESK